MNHPNLGGWVGSSSIPSTPLRRKSVMRNTRLMSWLNKTVNTLKRDVVFSVGDTTTHKWKCNWTNFVEMNHGRHFVARYSCLVGILSDMNWYYTFGTLRPNAKYCTFPEHHPEDTNPRTCSWLVPKDLQTGRTSHFSIMFGQSSLSGDRGERVDLLIRNIRVAQYTDLTLDFTMCLPSQDWGILWPSSDLHPQVW